MVEVYSELEWFFILYFCLQFLYTFKFEIKKSPQVTAGFSTVT